MKLITRMPNGGYIIGSGIARAAAAGPAPLSERLWVGLVRLIVRTLGAVFSLLPRKRG
jgi:hypothetical protein